MCSCHQILLASQCLRRAIELMEFGCNVKKREEIHSSVFDKFPNQHYYVQTTAHDGIFRLHCLLRIIVQVA